MYPTSISSNLSCGSFEDNFVPPINVTPPPGGLAGQFQKLPDSDEYLAVLEKKLKSVQQGSSDAKEKLAKDILKSLGESRESCMLNLLASDNSITSQEPTFEAFKINPVFGRIYPEKQALGADELIQLVKADQLELEVDETKVSVPNSPKKEDPDNLS